MSPSLLGFPIIERKKEVFKLPRRLGKTAPAQLSEAVWLLNWDMSAYGTWEARHVDRRVFVLLKFSESEVFGDFFFRLQLSSPLHRSAPLTSIYHERTNHKRGPIDENGHRFFRSSWYDFSRLVRNFQFDQTRMCRKPKIFFSVTLIHMLTLVRNLDCCSIRYLNQDPLQVFTKRCWKTPFELGHTAPRL